MNWTTYKPGARGWWWHRDGEGHRGVVVNVWEDGNCDLRCSFLFNGTDLIARVCGEWSDVPIPEPDEPTRVLFAVMMPSQIAGGSSEVAPGTGLWSTRERAEDEMGRLKAAPGGCAMNLWVEEVNASWW